MNKQTLKVFLILAVAMAMLCGCVPKPQVTQLTDLALPTLAKDQMAVIIKNGDKNYSSYTVTLSKDACNATTVEGVLDYLADTKVLRLVWEDGPYGKYLAQLGDLAPQGNQFVAVFTSLKSQQGAWAGVPSYQVDNVKLVSAQVGVTELSALAGVIVYFEISTY